VIKVTYKTREGVLILQFEGVGYYCPSAGVCWGVIYEIKSILEAQDRKKFLAEGLIWNNEGIPFEG
jgi:hypothetical protein